MHSGSLPIDHAMVSNLLHDADACDRAVEKASRGDYKAAYDIIAPILDSNSPLKQRAVEIAVKLFDSIIDEYMEEENYEASVYWLDKWLSIEPTALYPAVAKADILWLHLDRLDEAGRIYQAVVHKHPYCLEGWIGLAQIALAKGHLKRATQYVRRAWLSLAQPVWAYSPPTRSIVVNVMESLYVVTARVLIFLNQKQEGVDLLHQAVSDWGGSEYLLQALESIEKKKE